MAEPLALVQAGAWGVAQWAILDDTWPCPPSSPHAMPNPPAPKPATLIARQTPESAAMVASVQRALRLTPALNRLTYDDADEIRAVFGELIGKPVDPGFSLIPPFYTTGGENIRIGRNVFINQHCTLYDLGGIDIGDDVMIGPNVSLITSGHPLDPAQRRSGVTARPISIGKNVWIGAGATVIAGVTVGENSVVAAGSVVTRDVPANTLVAGNPARIIRPIGQDVGQDIGRNPDPAGNAEASAYNPPTQKTDETHPMRIAIASDHAGYELKEKLKQTFENVAWLDLGTHSDASVDYPDVGYAMGQAITDGRATTGIVICGSGIGISIAVNRYAAVRAALCTDTTMARLSRQHNDANVLALGSRIVGIEVARECVSTFLDTPFDGARHQRRIDMLGNAGQR